MGGAIQVDGYTADMLTTRQRAAIARIVSEPESVAVPSSNSHVEE